MPEAPESVQPADFSAESFSSFLGDDGEVRRPNPPPQRETLPRDASGRFVRGAEDVAPEEAEPEAAAASAEESAETPESEAAPEAEEAKPQEGIRSLSDLAKAFEIDEAELVSHLRIGEGDDAPTLADALTALRTPIEDRVATQVKSRVEVLDREYGERAKAAIEAHQQLTSAAERIFAELNARWPDDQMERLRQEDPAQFANAFFEKQRHEQLLQQSIAQLRAEEQRVQREREQAHEKWRQGEKEALLQLPEFKGWSDPKVAEKDATELGEYLLKSGFQRELVSELVDHRMVRVAWKAMQYDRLREKTLLAREKVQAAPKVIQTQARRPPEDRKEKTRVAAMNRLRETGTVEDATRAAIAAGLFDN